MTNGTHPDLLAELPVFPVAIIAIVVASVVLSRSRRRRVGRPAGLISVALWFATCWGVSSVGLAIVGLIENLTATAVKIAIPVDGFWPQLSSVGASGGAAITATTALDVNGQATVSIQGLTMSTRLLWTAGQFIGGLVPAMFEILVAIVCFRLLCGAAFAPAVARAAVICAVAVLVGGFATEILSGIAGSLAAHEVITAAGGSIPHALPLPSGPEGPLIAEVHTSTDFPFTIWPAAYALGLGVLAAIMRYGSRLQHDTEGLV